MAGEDGENAVLAVDQALSRDIDHVRVAVGHTAMGPPLNLTLATMVS